MSANEIINILNEEGEVISAIPRGQAERGNHLTENVLIFIFNSTGKVWVQLRSMSKNHYPGKWDISACGSVLSIETHEQGASRETFEETGIDMKLQHIESFLNVFQGDNGKERRRLSHLYVGISDETPQSNEEVDEFRDWHTDELRVHVTENPDLYVPSFMTEYDKALIGYQKLQKNSQI